MYLYITHSITLAPKSPVKTKVDWKTDSSNYAANLKEHNIRIIYSLLFTYKIKV